MGVESLAMRGRQLAAVGLWFAAGSVFEEWRRLADNTADLREQMRVRLVLGMVAVNLARWDDALEQFDQAYARATRLGQAEQMGRIALNRSSALAGRYQFKEALAAAQLALQHCGPDAPAQVLAPIYLNLGGYYLYAGDPAAAQGPLVQAEALFRSLDQPGLLGQAVCNLGICSLESGHLDDARANLAAATVLAEAAQDAQGLAYACTERGRVELALGSPEAAIGLGGRALDILWTNVSNLSKEEVARVCALFGEAAIAVGDKRTATRFMDRAVTYFAQLGLWREYDRIQAALQAAQTGPAHARVFLPPLATERLGYFTGLLDLLDSIESVYPQLRQEGEWVTHYALLLARAAGCGPEELAVLSHAGRLCDIGLTPLEEAAVEEAGERYRRHVLMSEQWLTSFPLPSGCLAAVRHHHEAWDGSGYPDGLAGDAIPVTAQILHVCQTYVAAAARLGHEHARVEVQAEAGRKLSPALVDAFMRMHAGEIREEADL